MRKSKTFKFVSWLLVFLFIFQADYLFTQSQVRKSDFEIQFELAEKESKAGKFDYAKKRLERLISALDKKIEKEKLLSEKANTLLEEIREKLEPKSPNMIKKEGKKKKKKFPWLLVIGITIVLSTVAYFLIIKK